MVAWAKKTLSGWGRYPQVPVQAARPERRQDVIKAFQDRDGDALLPHGLGRSYGDTALIKDGKVVLTRRLNKMLQFDDQTGWLRCEGGTSLAEIIEVFLPRGYFPPVVPGTQFVTVGGALACNIHGKNHHVDGCFADHVRRVEILTGKGDIVLCDRDCEPELFWATVGGMGLTGIVLSLELRLTPVLNAAIEMDTIRVENLDEFFAVSEESAEFTHVVSWIDIVKSGSAMGRGVFMRGRHATSETEMQSSPMDRLIEMVGKVVDGKPFESNLWLNMATMALFNEAFFRKEKPGLVSSTVHLTPFFFPLDAVSNWNYIYGKRGFLQYQMVVPTREATRAVLDEVSSSGQGSFLSVIKDFGPAVHGGLSFPTPGTTLAMDFPNTGKPLFDLMSRLDDIVADAGGRVYLGKDARLSKFHFQKMYPEWEKWKAIRDQWDPDGIFQSDLGRRLGLV